MKRSEIKKTLPKSVTDAQLRRVIKALNFDSGDAFDYSDFEVKQIQAAFDESSQQPAQKSTDLTKREANDHLNSAMTSALELEGMQIDRATRLGKGLAQRAMKRKVESFAEETDKLENQFYQVLQRFDEAFEAESALLMPVEVEDTESFLDGCVPSFARNQKHLPQPPNQLIEAAEQPPATSTQTGQTGLSDLEQLASTSVWDIQAESIKN